MRDAIPMSALAPVPGGTGTKHTPGPWVAKGYSVKLSHDPQAWRVAECHHGLGKPDEESLANALLIAAAPEMLEALQLLDASWTREFPQGPATEFREGCSFAADTLEIWLKTRTAIAKAKATPPVPGGA